MCTRIEQHTLNQNIPLPAISTESYNFHRKKKVQQTHHMFYVPNDTYIHIPWRYVSKLQSNINPSTDEHVDTTLSLVSTPPPSTFVGTLSLEQQEYAQMTFETLVRHRTALLSIKTGGGKTVIAIYVCCLLNIPVTILVHRNILVQQWKERCIQFAPQLSNITIKNVSSIKLDSMPDTWDQPHLLIIDEAHLFCTDRCTQIILRYPCTHSLALTATVERKDQRHKMLYRIYGLPVITTRVSQTFKIFSVETPFVFNLIFTKSRYSDVRTVKWVDMIRMQSECDERTEYIVRWVNVLVHSGYKVLVLSKFVDHCDKMVQLLSDFELSVVGVHGNRDLSDMPMDWSCIVGTYSKCSTGFDVPVNALVLASDTVGTFEQTLGRVFRTRIPPIIIDLVDTSTDHSVWLRHARERESFYTDCGGTLVRCEYTSLESLLSELTPT